MWILKFGESATACMTMWSAQVPYKDICDKYLNHEPSKLLSITRPGIFLKYCRANALTSKWWLWFPYNWCDTDLKKQSPPPPTSSALNPCLSSLEFNRNAGVVLHTNATELILQSRTGPGFNSTSPESKRFLFDALNASEHVVLLAWKKCLPKKLVCLIINSNAV